MLGIKSLHSRIHSLARDYHQLNLLRLPRISLVFTIQSLAWAAISDFLILNQSLQSAAFSHSATYPYIIFCANINLSALANYTIPSLSLSIPFFNFYFSMVTVQTKIEK